MLKTCCFAAMHFTVAFLVVYALTGSFIVGGVVALVEPTINTVAYHFHEKLWALKSNQQNTDKTDSTAAHKLIIL